MTDPSRADIEMGQLALALVMEDFGRRIAREEATEAEVAAIVDAALGRFPPEFESGLRDYMARRSPT